MRTRGAEKVSGAHITIACVECFTPIVVALDADERPVCTNVFQCEQRVLIAAEAVENRQRRILASV